jgi:hypothetical protein
MRDHRYGGNSQARGSVSGVRLDKERRFHDEEIYDYHIGSSYFAAFRDCTDRLSGDRWKEWRFPAVGIVNVRLGIRNFRIGRDKR